MVLPRALMIRLAAGLTVLATPVAAEPPPVPDPQAFLSTPTLAEIQAAYPSGARAYGVRGEVVVRCRTTYEGRMRDCTAMERPAGYGFAAAALSLTDRFRLDPGRARTDGLTQLTIVFEPAP